MKLISVTLLMFFSCLILTAQEKELFYGKVIDADTKRPIETVAIYGPSSNTISNRGGEFEIKSKYGEDLTISHLSYHIQIINTAGLPATIELKSKIFELPEVVIVPQETIIRELKKVWDKYDKLLKGKKDKEFPELAHYYRQLTFNNDTCVEYIESFLSAPTSIRLHSLSLQEGRYAKIKKDSVVVGFINYFMYSLVTPFSPGKAKSKSIIAPLCADFEKYYKVSINRVISPNQADEVTVYDFELIDILKFADPIFLTGLLYVRTNDRSIMRAELKSDKFGLNFTLGSSTKEAHSIIISYQEKDNYFPIVESIQANSIIDVEIQGIIYNMNIQSTLLATEYAFKKRGNRLKQKDFLFNQVMKSKHNQEFWDSNPVVKRTEIEQQILDDFNREGYFGTVNFEGK